MVARWKASARFFSWGLQVPEALQLAEVNKAAHGFIGDLYPVFHRRR